MLPTFSLNILEQVVDRVSYKPGWIFDLVDRGEYGYMLVVNCHAEDSQNPGEIIDVRHVFHVPPVQYGWQSWERWLLDQIVKIETHEASEFYQIGSSRPFYPDHDPSNDPYTLQRA